MDLQHKVAEVNVEVPTIMVDSLQEGGKAEVLIQWFGSSEGGDLGDHQFFFLLRAEPDSASLFGVPSEFKVVFLGQLSDLPFPDSSKLALIETFGSMDVWVAWLIKGDIALDAEGERVPASPVVELVPLMGPTCSPITPRPYCDLSVRDQAEDHCAKGGEQG